MDNGTDPAAPAAETEKTAVTGWTRRIEVIFTGEGASQVEAVPDATVTMETFMDALRTHPKIHLVKVSDPDFGTRKVGPQPQRRRTPRQFSSRKVNDAR